eukprot:scaffold3638_cov60-Phaeocystis_antarctica.AAC.5
MYQHEMFLRLPMLAAAAAAGVRVTAATAAAAAAAAAAARLFALHALDFLRCCASRGVARRAQLVQHPLVLRVGQLVAVDARLARALEDLDHVGLVGLLGLGLGL